MNLYHKKSSIANSDMVAFKVLRYCNHSKKLISPLSPEEHQYEMHTVVKSSLVREDTVIENGFHVLSQLQSANMLAKKLQEKFTVAVCEVVIPSKAKYYRGFYFFDIDDSKHDGMASNALVVRRILSIHPLDG